MFIWTAKVTRGRLVLAGLLIVVLLSAAILLFARPHKSSEVFHEGAPSLSTNAGRIAYLEQYGWQVSETPIDEEEVVIPIDLEESSPDYCALQDQQGFHIEDYEGKTVTRYTYTIENYPTGEENVHANIFIYDNMVIAGDVSTPALDGWMHGLSMP